MQNLSCASQVHVVGWTNRTPNLLSLNQHFVSYTETYKNTTFSLRFFAIVFYQSRDGISSDLLNICDMQSVVGDFSCFICMFGCCVKSNINVTVCFDASLC